MMNEDLLHNIIGRLPAKSFASAACVCKSWNKVCDQILSRPKIASACSFNTSARIALQEVVDKVLAEPIRPHFAIANVGRGFGLKRSLQILVEYLGSRTPIILSFVSGIIGKDALTHEFREVKFSNEELSGDDGEYVLANDVNAGIVLTIGFVPGLKVDAIPLLRRNKASRVSVVDQFVMDIRNYTTSVSDRTSPLAIIMFGDEGTDLKHTIEKLDYAMSMETVIVGDESCQFLYRSRNDLRSACASPKYDSHAVALIFASDRDKRNGTGEIQFHSALSKGVQALGPRYKTVSVIPKDSIWLTARREGQQEILGGRQMLGHIEDELENGSRLPALYIGVTKRRKCSIGSEKTGLISSLAFHGVEEGDEEYLYVDGVGIRSSDYFQFYCPDRTVALASCRNISMKLRELKLQYDSTSCVQTRSDNVGKKEILGGLIFSCCGRGDSFFGCVNIDSSPFLENFPEVPIAGIFCGGEIGRGYSSLMGQESQEESSAHCCLHVFSTVYLVISYTPASSES